MGPKQKAAAAAPAAIKAGPLVEDPVNKEMLLKVKQAYKESVVTNHQARIAMYICTHTDTQV